MTPLRFVNAGPFSRAVTHGTVVALAVCMSKALLTTATMSCPVCERPVEPAADSTWVIAWYSCPRCGHEWSARIRNGRPDALSTGEALVHTKASMR